ncbi:peptidoglycan DD-metalloendopeptidase family protein [Marinobacter zhejiangensis]|nr:peptidoglycan DD-metalloendopeptidase family protein [Marinobacter zhejiangensis]
MVVIFALSAFLSACNTSAIYQDDSYNPPVYWGQHVVKRGETLYSIAWRYGRDYRELGNANGITSPYLIREGQVLRLDLRGTVTTTGQTGSVASSSGSAASRPAARPPVSRPPAPVQQPVVTRPPVSSGAQADRTQVVSNIEWRWPHPGTVIAGYSTTGKVNKGLDIAGNSGDQIRAAASGSVVYAGSGLLGYGNLIIVNHNEHFLSAYAHNRNILVQEGQNVQAGQVIAELGSSGTDRPKLHFEIRKNGNPVDPAQYLPPR